ncbi:uncharacterized protein LOC112559649 [Pomacea canaliculata]|uniref:uncharacterized protein LOC112559649 n=1 Tax=Pomacea canaliculata TaxID=400727 RepID=UPI000D72A120|nr:uncharacterized protein LOC112559649 [Pomacea canaliculata]
MKRRAVLVLILLTQTVSVVSALNKTVYTYYGDQAKMSWQSAVAFCQEQGQNMISPSTQLHTDILNTIATQADGKPWFNKIQDTWISLHDPNVTNPGVGYHWLMRANNTCAPLGVWSNWYQGSPQNKVVNHCVKATWTSTGLQWVTEQCSVTLRVMCVSSAGPCLFSDGWANSTINTDSLAVVMSARTSVACMDLCHSTAAFGLDCWAAEWTAASSNCTLRMSDRPFNNSSLNFSMGTTVFLATCHVGVYDETTKPLVSTSLMYDPPCTEGSGISSFHKFAHSSSFPLFSFYILTGKHRHDTDFSL